MTNLKRTRRLACRSAALSTVLLLVAAAAVVWRSFTQPSSPTSSLFPHPNSTDSSSITCRMVLMERMMAPGHDSPHDEFYACHPVMDGMERASFYELDHLPESFLAPHPTLPQQIRNGTPVLLELDNAHITNDDRIVLEDSDNIRLVPQDMFDYRHRQLRSAPAHSGTLTLLPMRVITADAAPDVSNQRLYEQLFTDDISLTQQFQACSLGALQIRPLTNVGVLDVSIPEMEASNHKYNTLMNAAADAAAELLGERDIRDAADLVLYVLPPGTEGNWAAFGTINGVGTVFNDKWASYTGATLHEVGHNLGLFHANEHGMEYSDITGNMGSAPEAENYPQRCFNAQNYWHLGWLEDQAIELDIDDEPSLVTLAAFVDAPLATDDDQHVLVKADDFYLLYNVAKSFNQDTGEYAEQVVVVQETKEGTDLVAALDRENPRHVEFLGNKKKDETMLTIEVCHIIKGSFVKPDAMVLSIGFGGTSVCPEEDTSDGDSSFGGRQDDDKDDDIEVVTLSPTYEPRNRPPTMPRDYDNRRHDDRDDDSSDNDDENASPPRENNVFDRDSDDESENAPTEEPTMIISDTLAPDDSPPNVANFADTQSQTPRTKEIPFMAGIIFGSLTIVCIIAICYLRRRSKRERAGYLVENSSSLSMSKDYGLEEYDGFDTESSDSSENETIRPVRIHQVERETSGLSSPNDIDYNSEWNYTLERGCVESGPNLARQTTDQYNYCSNDFFWPHEEPEQSQEVEGVFNDDHVRSQTPVTSHRTRHNPADEPADGVWNNSRDSSHHRSPRSRIAASLESRILDIERRGYEIEQEIGQSSSPTPFFQEAPSRQMPQHGFSRTRASPLYETRSGNYYTSRTTASPLYDSGRNRASPLYETRSGRVYDDNILSEFQLEHPQPTSRWDQARRDRYRDDVRRVRANLRQTGFYS